jgi:hypothetical protein
MEGTELLSTFAEVSVAFAGFASLVSILGGRSSSEQLTANLVRLQGMLLSAMIVLAFSLAPFLPYKFGVSSQASWRAVGAIFALGALGSMPSSYRRVFASPVNRRVAVSIFLVQLAAGIGLAAAVAFPTSISVVGAYHAMLFAYLGIASVLFMRVVASAYSSGTRAA